MFNCSSVFHWYCPECEGKTIRSLKTDREVEDRCAAYMSKMEARMSSLESTVQSKVSREEVNKEMVKSAVHPDTDPTVVKDLVQDEVSRVLGERDERDSRRNNFIIHNMPESDKEEDEDKKEQDLSLCLSLISMQLRLTCKPPINVIRLGAQRDGKPRPVKVIMCDENDKVNILRSTYRLKGAPEPYKLMSLATDMSREERERNSELVAEARRMNDDEQSGDWLHVVRGNPWQRKILRVKRRT